MRAGWGEDVGEVGRRGDAEAAELLAAQVSEAMFLLSFYDKMKFELIVNGAVACLGAMMSRNEKRTQRFVVGSLQNLLGATGNSKTSVDTDVEKMTLANEVEEMKHFSRLWDRFANSGNFLESLPLLWSQATSPFEAFRAFSRYVLAEQERSHSLSLVDRVKALLSYLTQEQGLDLRVVKGALFRDYHRGARRKPLRLLGRSDPSGEPAQVERSFLGEGGRPQVVTGGGDRWARGTPRPAQPPWLPHGVR